MGYFILVIFIVYNSFRIFLRQAGTDDLKTLTAIYSQLGNAYFYLGEYSKAMQYHKHDLTLAR